MLFVNLEGSNAQVAIGDKSFHDAQENRLRLLHFTSLGAELARRSNSQASEPWLYGGKAVRNPQDSAGYGRSRWNKLYTFPFQSFFPIFREKLLQRTTV